MVFNSRIILTLVGSMVLSACGNEPGTGTQSPPTAVAAPVANAPVSVSDAGPVVVDEAKIVPIDPAQLAAAEWTRKSCSLDSVDGGEAENGLTKGQPHVFRGFIVGMDDAPAGEFSLVLKGDASFEIPASTGAVRPDVAEFFKNEALASAGFDFSTTLSAVPAGQYSVMFLMRNGERSFFCEAGKTITVI